MYLPLKGIYIYTYLHYRKRQTIIKKLKKKINSQAYEHIRKIIL